MNQQIIEQFEKLINQIKSDIDNSVNKEDKIKHGYRLKQIKNALKIIKEYKYVIKSGDELADYKGIGVGTVARVNEILKTGTLKEIAIGSKYERQQLAIKNLEQIFGIGYVTAKDLVVNDNITSVEELKKKHDQGKIILPPQIEMGLKYYGVFKENIPRKEIDSINVLLQKIGKEIDKKLIVTICGSYRRGKPVSSDIDILLSHSKNYTHDFVKKLKEHKFIMDDLTTDFDVKYMGYCKYLNNPVRRIDIKYVKPESYFTALMHFTGGKLFNVQIRELAKHLNYMLNEYGLYKVKNGVKVRVEINSEKDIFDALGLEYIPPNKRD